MTACASALLVMVGGGAAGVAALTDEPRIVTTVGADRPVPVPAMPQQVPNAMAPRPSIADSGLGVAARIAGEQADRRTSDVADRTATRAPRRSGTDLAARGADGKDEPADRPTAEPRPAITTRTVIETRVIPYRTRLVRDPEMPRGSKRIQTEGVPGEQTLQWLVTYADGQPTDRRLIDSQVTRQPQHRVVVLGTRRGSGDQPDECRPGSDRCFPIGRSATCPDEAGQAPTESAALPGSLLDADFYLLSAEDLDGLELDPGLLC